MIVTDSDDNVIDGNDAGPASAAVLDAIPPALGAFRGGSPVPVLTYLHHDSSITCL